MKERTNLAKVACLINPKAANSKWLRRKKLRAYLEKKLPGEIHDASGDARTTVERARSSRQAPMPAQLKCRPVRR